MKKRISPNEALVAVLAVTMVGSAVYPMLAQGRSQGESSMCLRNMKQIGTSVMLYAQDWDDVLPVTTERKPKKGFGAHWTFIVQPYLRSAETFVCPNDALPALAGVDRDSPVEAAPRLSYINNYAAIPAHDFYPVPRSVLTDPGMLILIAERRSTTPRGVSLATWKGTSGFVPGQPCHDVALGAGYRRVDVGLAERWLREADDDKDLLVIRTHWSAHGETRSNYTFADGHARWMPLAETLDPTSFKWGERFYPRSEPKANCDGPVASRPVTSPVRMKRTG